MSYKNISNMITQSFIKDLSYYRGMFLFEKTTTTFKTKAIQQFEDFSKLNNFSFPPKFKKFMVENSRKKVVDENIENLIADSGFILHIGNLNISDNCTYYDFNSFLPLEKILGEPSSVVDDLEKWYSWKLIRIAYASGGAGNGFYLGIGAENKDKIYRVNYEDLPDKMFIDTNNIPFEARNGLKLLANDIYDFVDTLSLCLMKY
jgi:hypothetical protein